MATKAQVKRLAEKQGAEFSFGYNSYGDAFLEIILPNEFVWDNGYGSGSLVQEKYEDESMAQFWQNAFDYINANVVKSNTN